MYPNKLKFPVHSYLVSLIDAPVTLKRNKKFVRFLRNILHESLRFDIVPNPNPDLRDEYPDYITLSISVCEGDYDNIFKKFNLWADSFQKDPSESLAKLMMVELNQDHKICSVWEIDKVFPSAIGKMNQHAQDEQAMVMIELSCSIIPFCK